MIDISGLEQAVAAEKTQLDSFVTFVEELKTQLHAELADDPAAQAKIDAFMDQLAANKQLMADAMTANVP
jgi:hypothetical protein